MTPTSIVDGSVPIKTFPTLPFQRNALKKLNATAWEYWYFDGISTDIKSGITIIFYRDNNLQSAGVAPFRVSIDAFWSSGSKYSRLMWARNSTVKTCGDATRGIWRSKYADATFDSAHGNKDTFIRLDGMSSLGDHLSGTFYLKSTFNARHSKGELYPDHKASVQVAPLSYWKEGILGGEVTVNFTLNGEKLAFRGIGGASGNYASFSWDSLFSSWWWVRAVAGPFTMSYWKFVSAIDNNTYSYAYLEKKGEQVFTSTEQCVGDNVGCTIFTPKGQGDGNVKGIFDSIPTGFVIEYWEDTKLRGKGRKWRFHIDRVHVIFEASPGSKNEYSKYVNSVRGGEIREFGTRTYEGHSISVQSRVRNNAPLS